MERELITQAEYARRRGITPPSVCAAVKSGRISLIEGRIDPDIADREWDRNTDHAKREAAFGGRYRERVETAGVISAAEAGENTAKEFMAWKARRECAEALRAELAYEQEAGNFYRKPDCNRAAKTMARLLRDQLLSIPLRIAAELAAITDVPAIEQLITTEIRRALERVEKSAKEAAHD